jgi:capsular exopolysaccharide synthesis family protein
MSQSSDQDFFSSNGNSQITGRYFGENISELSSQSEKEKDFDIKEIIGLILHNRWTILIITLLITISSFVVAKYITPVYLSEGTIMVTQAQNGYSMSGSDISNLLMNSYGIGLGSSIFNEMEILNSRYFSILLAKKLYENRILSDSTLAPVFWKDYEEGDSTEVSIEIASERILANKEIESAGRASDILRIRFRSPNPREAFLMVNLIIETYSKYSTDQNRAQAKEAISFLTQEKGRLEKIVHEKEREFRRFMEEKRIVSIDQQTSDLINRMSRLDTDMQSLRTRLLGVDASISNYQKELDQILPGIASMISKSIAPKFQRLQIALAELETEKIQFLAKNPGLNEHPQASKRIIELNQQIEVITNEISSITQSVIDSGSKRMLNFLVQSDGNIGASVNRIQEELSKLYVEKAQLENQISFLKPEIANLEKFFVGLPENMMNYAQLRREVSVNEQLFLTISKQSAEMALWEQTQAGSARVVDYASYPKSPIEPRVNLFIFVGFFLGGILSLAIVFVKEFLKQEIDSVEKLRSKNYPILSVIPNLDPYVEEHFKGDLTVEVAGRKVSTSLVTLLDNISPAAESYRRLQSNIMYSKPDDPYRVILITSSNKSEGKTTLTANLAISMAETGNRVLVIDCDFRRPRIHSVFGYDSSPGVIDILFASSEIDVHSFIHKSVIDNVFVLTAGNRPTNPAEINRSKKLRNLIQKLRYEFDYIILDTPPYGIITDAAPLIKLADGAVVVVKFNQTKGSELDHTLDSLVKINTNIIGTTMTAFDPKKSSGYYYTDYSYAYAYESYKEYDKRDD